MIRSRKTLNIAYLLLVALFVSLCLPFFTPLNIPKAATHPSLSGGSGTANDPYLISTATDMTYLSNHVMNGGETSGKYYKLTNAINMLNTIWQTNDYINNGYPYLKSIYWSGGAQSF